MPITIPMPIPIQSLASLDDTANPPTQGYPQNLLSTLRGVLKTQCKKNAI